MLTYMHKQHATANLSPTIWSTIVLLLLSMPISQPVHGKDTSSEGEPLRSSLAGLKLDTVYLRVSTDYAHQSTIEDRVLRALNARGLHTRTDWPYQQGKPLLKLTLRTEALSDRPSDKVLYYQNFELFENVISERSPHIKTWTVTWTYGLPDPIVTDMVSLEQLEKDADEFVEHFIRDFLYANKK